MALLKKEERGEVYGEKLLVPARFSFMRRCKRKDVTNEGGGSQGDTKLD